MKCKYDSDRNMYLVEFEDVATEYLMMCHVADKHNLVGVRRRLDEAMNSNCVYLTCDELRAYLKWVG